MRALKAFPPGNDNPTPSWIDQVIADTVACKLDTLELFIASGRALYASDVLPRSSCVTADYDPLRYALDKANLAGIKLVAWVCFGLLPSSAAWRGRYLASNPTWDVQYHVPAAPHWLNFDDPGARAHCAAIARELAVNYPGLYAVALDYFRYDNNGDTSDPRHYPEYFTAAGITRAAGQVADAIHDGGALAVAHVFAGWGGQNLVLQRWDTDWMAQTDIDIYTPMAYVSTNGYNGHPWREVYDHFIADWKKSTDPVGIYPALAFRNEDGDKAMKTAAQFQEQCEYVNAQFGLTNVGYFGHYTLTEEIKTYLASIAPSQLDYIIVMNLLPQDATLDEKWSVLQAVHDSKQTILQSADDARNLVLRGASGSKVVVWGAARWQDDIVAWLSPCAVECREF